MHSLARHTHTYDRQWQQKTAEKWHQQPQAAAAAILYTQPLPLVKSVRRSVIVDVIRHLARLVAQSYVPLSLVRCITRLIESYRFFSPAPSLLLLLLFAAVSPSPGTLTQNDAEHTHRQTRTCVCPAAAALI